MKKDPDPVEEAPDEELADDPVDELINVDDVDKPPTPRGEVRGRRNPDLL